MAMALGTEEERWRGVTKGIKDIIVGEGEAARSVPPRYICPLHERPLLSEVRQNVDIPLIDISPLFTSSPSPEQNQVISQIGQACAEWGFFQVVNHGVPQLVMDQLLSASESFFELPAEQKMQYFNEDPFNEVGYVTSFNPSKETFMNWKDSLRFRREPQGFQGFEEAPPFCRKPALDYVKEMEGLGNRLYSAIFQSAGLSMDYLDDVLPDIPIITMSLHYYPPCPDPTLTLGINAHSDFTSLTILLQGEVEGLQVFKDGQWVAVKPVPNAFVVNIGDQVEILTNGKYKSVEHRVVTNTKKARMSVACFFSPSVDARVAPLDKLVSETNRSLYKEVVSGKYIAECWAKSLSRKSNLDVSLLV